MKKRFTTIVTSAVMAGVIGLSGIALAACGKEGENSGNGFTLKLEIEPKGFGIAWLEEIAQNYTAATGQKVKVTPIYAQNLIRTKLESGQSNSDIVFFVGNGFNAQEKNMLADISDVIELPAMNEDKPIKDKINSSVLNYLTDDEGKLYQLSWANTVSSLCYNETMLNDVLGTDSWEIPNTTQELFALLDEIKASPSKSNGDYGFADCLSEGYGNYLFKTWWAQYDGYDSFRDFFNGYYYVDGVRTEAKNGEMYYNAGREKSLQVCSDLFKKSNGHIHPLCERADYNEAQIIFAGSGYRGTPARAAFIANGDWIESELSSTLQTAAQQGKPQSIKMMKIPMISSITETLEAKTMSDATLSKVIEAIDGGVTSYEGVSENDFNTIATARRMVYSLVYEHPFGIPANSKHIDAAKEFLKYLLSDDAQSVYAKKLHGMTMAVEYEQKEGDVSEFMNSRFASYDNTYQPIANNFSASLFRRGKVVDIKSTAGFIDGDLFNGVTPKEILDKTYNLSIDLLK